MFPVTFPVTFHFRLHNPDISVGSRSVPQSDRSKVSYFPRFVGRVRSQGFRGRSRFGSCLETELGIRFPIPTGFGRQVGRVGSKVKPGLDPTGIHHWFSLVDIYMICLSWLHPVFWCLSSTHTWELIKSIHQQCLDWFSRDAINRIIEKGANYSNTHKVCENCSYTHFTLYIQVFGILAPTLSDFN